MARKIIDKPFGSGTYTKSQFFSFIRAALRQKSRRWKPIYDCLNAAKRPSKSKNKRLKWEYQCAKCKKWFANTDVSVDHIVPAGSLRELEDLPLFVRTLFCEIDNLQVLCSKDHDLKTKQEREDRKNASM